MTTENSPSEVDELLNLPSEALENADFKAFLDHVPIAVVVSEFHGNHERIVYSNIEFERISGHIPEELRGRQWLILDQHLEDGSAQHGLGQAVLEGEEYIGTFRLDRGAAGIALADAYSNVIVDDDGQPRFRLLALVDVTTRQRAQREELDQQIREKDFLLKELQHRVKNNLQLITALIRLEARSSRKEGRTQLDRLAGRIESLQLLYQALLADGRQQEVDLGHYLGQIASAVMHTHGIKGIRLDLKLDYVLMSINIAMPVGLLVNELLTNAFKYAFNGRAHGIITLRAFRESHDRCQVVVGDDGIGLPEGTEWPPRGKIAALMLQSLRENAGTDWNVRTASNQGTHISFSFSTKLKTKANAGTMKLNGAFLVKGDPTIPAVPPAGEQ